MKLFFRTLLALLRAALPRPRIGLLDESLVPFRVWPTDLDLNLHLNNARYLSLMDIGRFEMLSRAGMLRGFARNRWYPIVGAVMLRFRRSLDPWQKFELRTRIVGWDEKWFYLEQRFERAGELHAYGLVRAVIRSAGATVPTTAVLSAFGYSAHSPRMPQMFEEWRATLEHGGERSQDGARKTA